MKLTERIIFSIMILTVICIGLWQETKIKELKQKLYSAERYSHHLEEINDYVLFGDTKYNKKGE